MATQGPAAISLITDQQQGQAHMENTYEQAIQLIMRQYSLERRAVIFRHWDLVIEAITEDRVVAPGHNQP
jgi:3-hydroxyacyl-CoA dehydrogenase